MKPISLNRNNLSEWLLCIYVFFLPFFQQASVSALVLMLINILLSGNIKITIGNVFRHKIFLFLVLYYAIHVIGLLYTENFDYAFFDLGTKLSFLIVPFLFAGLILNEELLARIKLFFSAGCFVSIIISLVHSIYLYRQQQWVNDFFYEKFSWFNHPTYITVYINIALLFLLEYLFTRWKKISKPSRSFVIFTGYLFIAAIIMYSSRTGTAVAAFSLLIYSVILLKKNFIRRPVIITALFAVLLTTGLMYYFSLTFFNRYAELGTEMREEIEKVSEGGIKSDSTITDNSASSRILAWQYSLQLIKTNWLIGVGTGDIKDELVKKYNEAGWNFGAEKKLNPHNQYLHTFILLGIPGFILLMLNFIFPFYFSLKQKHGLYFLFMMIVFLNCLTESVLEVQRGILLFPFFSCLFYIAALNSTNQEKK